MVPITDSRIEGYLLRLAGEDDPYLSEMEERARKSGFPIVDRLVGRLLFVLTKMKKPRLIVELGSGFGYSAYWFAKALEKGKVILTDIDRDNIASARDTFRRAGLAHKAEFIVGDAVQAARAYRPIDILFVDIEKHQYVEALQELMPNLNRNALIIADNVLWYGRVTERKRDRETLGIKKFNSYLFSNRNFFTTIVPLRDGVLIAYKLS